MHQQHIDNFQRAIVSLGRPKTVGEAIDAIRSQYGRKAAQQAQERLDEVAVPDTLGEALAAIRADHTGRGGASHWLAERFGISLRQAQRYLAGRGLSERTAASRRRRAEIIEAAAAPRRERYEQRRAETLAQVSRRYVAAALLRRATYVHVGRPRVWDLSQDRPDGSRDVGLHQVGVTLSKTELQTVARNIEAGNWEAAAEDFSNAMLDAYSASKGDPAGTASGPLYIYEYPTGIQVETT